MAFLLQFLISDVSETITIAAAPVLSIKNIIQDRCGVPVDKKRLIYAGRALDNVAPLEQFWKATSGPLLLLLMVDLHQNEKVAGAQDTGVLVGGTVAATAPELVGATDLRNLISKQMQGLLPVQQKLGHHEQ
jgi:hypothetical protein